VPQWGFKYFNIESKFNLTELLRCSYSIESLLERNPGSDSSVNN